jgi:hypothetical protein
MDTAATELLGFLETQIRTYGGNVEIDPGLWALLVVPVTDTENRTLARQLLTTAPFAHEEGTSEDDGLVIHYVTEANRPAAVHWLDDLVKMHTGQIRPIPTEQQALIDAVVSSDKPHRAAKDLADQHERGAIVAGVIRDPQTVRRLLDRLHAREPLFFTALHTLLSHHLVDMLIFFRQLIAEDITLANEIVKSGLSRDPFLQSRQDSMAEIRNYLITFRIINPMDQQKNHGIANPYTAYLELAVAGDEIIAPIDGLKVTLQRTDFLNAIHSIRGNLYQGQSFESFDTQSPWITPAIAHPFRFIRQRLTARADLAPLDALYMLERAVAL